MNRINLGLRSVVAVVSGVAVGLFLALSPTLASAWVSKADFGPGVFGSAEATAVQPDGKIVAAGFTSMSRFTPKLGLARYLPDGSLDATFGGDGTVRVASPGLNNLWNLRLQPDGKILVVSANFQDGWKLRLTRVNSDGTLDRAFADEGFATINRQLESSRTIDYVDVDPKGRVVIAERDDVRISKRRWGTQMVIWRLNPDGSRDRTLGGDGLIRRSGRWARRTTGIYTQADGSLTAIGATLGPETKRGIGFMGRPSMMKFKPDGSPDHGFGNRGIKMMPAFSTGSSKSALTSCQVNGGTFDSQGRAVSIAFCFEEFKAGGWGLTGVIGRYTADGTPDPSFNGGKARLLRAPLAPFWTKVVIAPDDSIVAVGTQINTSKDSIVLAGLEEDGSVSPGFGPKGVNFIRGASSQFRYGTLSAGENNLYAGVTRPIRPRKDDFEYFSVMSMSKTGSRD